MKTPAQFFETTGEDESGLEKTAISTIVAYPRKKEPLPRAEYLSFVEQFLLIL